jgi:hypothetical protein
VGDLIVIPPLAPTAVIPVNGQFRSYHMLYLDARGALPICLRRTTISGFARAILLSAIGNCSSTMHLVALMQQRQTRG